MKRNVKYVLPVHVHLDHSTKLMIIRSNIVAIYQVNNNLWPVLKVILPPMEEAQRFERFEYLEWFPVGDRHYQELTFEVTDDEGNLYEFGDYCVTLILKFKPL